MQLLKILNVLASIEAEQIEYLIKLGTFPLTDEFALEFDDAYQFFLNNIDERKKNNSIDKLFLDKLNEIDLIFIEMSNINGNVFWNVSSLNLAEWVTIRKLAEEALVMYQMC